MPGVRPASAGDASACVQIVRGLSEYFTDDVPDLVRHGLETHDAWVLVEGDDVEAFVVVERRSPGAAEILWMATRHDGRNRGSGTRLLEHVLDVLRDDHVQLVEVKTLDRSAGYEPYEATRAFWERRGFVQVDTIDPFPGWEPGNPCAVYVAALQPTR